MKLTVDLENLTADQEFDTRVAQVIRDEIEGEVRRMVRAAFKLAKADVEKQVARAVADATKRLKDERIREIAKRMMGDVESN
jgi:hypothetical protein